MASVLQRLIGGAVVAIGLSAALLTVGTAAPISGHRTVLDHADAQPLVQTVHGFHCRKELGWDPLAGVYHWHRHEGICRDYQGCLREHQKCIFVLGRGWDSWRYERWGFDNWTYSACMIRAHCY